MKFAIVGAGFTGAVIANKLAEQGHQITVFDSRPHLAGNCYTERDKKTNILLHKYGPHIFHTDDKEVWDLVNAHTNFKSYVNRVKTTVNGKVFSLPINLHTINQFFDKALSPSQAKEFIETLADSSIAEAKSFEDQALKFLGKDLYRAFFYGYTKKQWGLEPKELPASILKRLPVRFNYNDNYFNHKYQGMPENGYTPIVESLLSKDNILIKLNTVAQRGLENEFDHIFYSGPLDAWFNYSLGRLGYRTLKFKYHYSTGDHQGCAVMNYGDETVPFTRIAEHKHFSPWEDHEQTVYVKEFSSDCGENDIPYYPIRLLKEKKMLQSYISLAEQEHNVSFVGRLGTYRYLDMDVTIREALDASQLTIEALANCRPIPTFFNSPL